ncbi:hypothetical protein [Rhizobium sp. Rhizsp82]
MIWSIIRLRAARRMLYLSRWLLQTGEAIVDGEMAKAINQRTQSPTI